MNIEKLECCINNCAKEFWNYDMQTCSKCGYSGIITNINLPEKIKILIATAKEWRNTARPRSKEAISLVYAIDALDYDD